MSDSEPEPAGLEGLPPLYSISKGEVVSVQTYGAFVRLPGYKKEGLVHVSEMSATRVESAAEIVDVGEKVWIKVIGREFQDRKSHPNELPPEPEVTIAFPARFGPPNLAGFGSVYFLFQINGEKIKLSFSMKAVNQGTGRDLDPNNVMAEQDARRRRQFRDHTGNRITLEAVLNTTCTKCGCKGHFTKDCFSAPGLQYALVPEEGDEEPQQQLQQPTTAAAQKEKDKKKKKKEKKMKKRKRERKGSDSDDNTSEGSECKPKRRCRERDDAQKHKKKHKKHKSHKRS